MHTTLFYDYKSLLFVRELRSRVGIKGNERIDRLAQSATRNTDVDKVIEYEILEHNSKIQRHVLCLWQDL